MIPVEQNSNIQNSASNQKQENVDEFQIVEAQAPLCRINADRQQPQAVCCFWLINFGIIIVIFGLVFAVPQVTKLKSNTQAFKYFNTSCFNPIGFEENGDIKCQNFSSSNPKIGLILARVTNLNQFALLYFKMKITPVQQQGFYIDQNFTVNINRLKSHNLQVDWKKRFQLLEENVYSSTIQFQATQQQLQQILDAKRSDDDDQQDDNNHVSFNPLLGFDRQLQNHLKQYFSHYLIVVQVQKANQIAQHCDQIQLKSVVVNQSNTIYIIVLRYIYLAVSIFTAIVFLRRYRRIPDNDKTIEQRFVAVISVLVFLFNDPFYAATVLAPNGFSTFLSIFFVVIFILCLLGLIIMFLIRIYKDQGRREVTLQRWKKCALSFYFVIFFFFTITLYCMFAYQSMNKPVISLDFLNYQEFQGMLITTFIWISIGLVIIAGLYLAIIISCRSRTFMWRNILYLSYSTFYIIIIFVALFEFAFVPKNFTYQSEGLVLVAYSYCNLYVYVLQYMYYTPRKDLLQAKKRQERVHDIQSNTIMSDINPIDLSSSDHAIKKKQQYNYKKDLEQD